MPIDSDEFAEILPLFPEQTEEAIRERHAAWANEGLTPDDVDQWTDVRPGTWFYFFDELNVRDTAMIFDLMGTEVPSSAMTMWSWGEHLDDLAEGLLVERNAATPATGFVTFYGFPGLTIGSGARVGVEVVDPDADQQEYEVQQSGTIGENLGAPGGLAGVVVNTGGALVNDTYYYVVTAINAEGETVESGEEDVVVASGGDGIVNLTWTAVTGATGYRVYRSLDTGGPYGFLAETVVASFSDDGDPTPNMGVNPPAEDSTGERVTLPVTSVVAGQGTNAATGQVTVPISNVGATSLVNLAPLVNGTDAESDESLRAKLQSRNVPKGPGNINDYVVWAQTYGNGIGRVTVVPTWDGPGTVLVIILTESGDPLSAEVVTGLQNFLDPVPGQGEGLAPVGHTVTVATATAVNVDVAMTIEFETGYSLDGASGTIALRDQIRTVIASYIESVSPGEEIVRQKIAARVAFFEGVHDVSVPTINGATSNLTLDDDPAQVGELDDLTLTAGSV